MTGCELRIFGVGNNRSTNCAITTALLWFYCQPFYVFSSLILSVVLCVCFIPFCVFVGHHRNIKLSLFWAVRQEIF